MGLSNGDTLPEVRCRICFQVIVNIIYVSKFQSILILKLWLILVLNLWSTLDLHLWSTLIQKFQKHTASGCHDCSSVFELRPICTVICSQTNATTIPPLSGRNIKIAELFIFDMILVICFGKARTKFVFVFWPAAKVSLLCFLIG